MKSQDTVADKEAFDNLAGNPIEIQIKEMSGHYLEINSLLATGRGRKSWSDTTVLGQTNQTLLTAICYESFQGPSYRNS